MKLYYAHYPSLEKQFVRWIQTQRTRPLDKWLILCSSSLVARRLQTLLAQTCGVLANIHFTTFSVLIHQLDQEIADTSRPLLPQNHLRDFLIKELLLSPGLNRYPVSRGFVQTVKSALRDLGDSLAEPDILEEHLYSMPDDILQADGGRFAWIIRLYRRYLEQENNVPGYRSYTQAFRHILDHLEHSDYLHGFSQLVLYGFYDMPGRQLELINQLKNTYPLTVFAPYEKHPAYRFAQKFFETHFLATPGAQDVSAAVPGALGNSRACLFNAPETAPATGVHLVSVPDVHGAVFYTAKEMLRLHEQEGYAWADMAIITRALPPYQDEIRRAFQANYIPLNASFTYPLTHYTLGTFCITLFSLAQQGFVRTQVTALFTSPYFKQPNKLRWKQSLHRCAVNRDVSQWQDLLAQATGPQAEVLHWIQQTNHQLEDLAQPQSWQEGAQKALDFLAAWTDTDAFQGKDAEIYQTLREAIRQLADYGNIRPQSNPGELIREIIDVLSTLTFNEAENIPGGVTVTDAVRARGLQFKTVFVLGVNDGEFPPVVGEDPILRDYYRIVLRDTLGYWINASLDRLDEERLLFYTVLTAAQEKLYVLTARRTADGKETLPSVYAAELARACNTSVAPEQMIQVSGYLSERLAGCPPAFLTPKELSYRFILHPASAQQHYRQAGLLDENKIRSLQAAKNLSSRGNLNAFDGLIQSAEQVFAQQNKKGFSPSALQEIATCPLKYFLHHGLHLEEPEPPLSRQALAANEQGSASHAVLKDFYETLHTQHLTHDLFQAGISHYLKQAFDKYYSPTAYQLYGIYPVVWELITENIYRTLTDFVVKDLGKLDGFIPTFFEQQIQISPTEELPFKLYGFIDRIDTHTAAPNLRIVDYKSTRQGTAQLARDFFTRLSFQPFLYMWMLKTTDSFKQYTIEEACLLTLANYHKQTLSQADFESMRPQACQFLRTLVQFIKQGTFFMNPSPSCKYCPYAMLCRKDAFYPLLRARNSTFAHTLQEMRQ